MIEFKDVVKKYGDRTVLDKVSFTIEEGKIVVLIGPSGCGKTTTLKSINRLIVPDSGEILINDKNISGTNPAQLRRTIGYVIQQIGLFPNMTVAQNITVVPRLLKYSKAKCDEIVKEMLELVGMPYEENAHKYPSELSGGQQQRVGVLRALAASPPIVLMDEPFSALDPITRELLQDEIINIHQKLKKTIVFVTHDMGEALHLADMIIFMESGKVVQMASPEEILKNPATDTVRTFMGRHIGNEKTLTAEDFMKRKPLRARKTRTTVECIDMMARSGVTSIIVINDDETLYGVATVESIKAVGKSVNEIGNIPMTEIKVVKTSDDARDVFDILLKTNDSFLVVVSEDDKVVGVITRTSMVKAMSEALWGDAT